MLRRFNPALERYFSIAVVEAKEEVKHHAAGIQQAMNSG